MSEFAVPVRLYQPHWGDGGPASQPEAQRRMAAAFPQLAAISLPDDAAALLHQVWQRLEHAEKTAAAQRSAAKKQLSKLDVLKAEQGRSKVRVRARARAACARHARLCGRRMRRILLGAGVA